MPMRTGLKAKLCLAIPERTIVNYSLLGNAWLLLELKDGLSGYGN